ncbi:LysR family transcriptional regulator [Rhizobium lentis]|uniref:LysR family transcriptional regulator n=1 Tax=Rhizobium lentis TaxID=1138194 RepID=A0ABS7IEE1_9HYPH|nr:LysR family transcriptional regulator [Rhizobium lentis]MBX5088380.1 LysR family transcriptional regulator [Rhizobium lentis]
MPEQPSLRNLQAFEAIGRCGGVTAAARDLGVSAGAISQHVHLIEESLGVKLIERRGRTVELTSWGMLYYQEIAKGFSMIRGAQDVIHRARNADAITLSALPSVASRWIGQRIFEWQEKHPASNIRIVGTDNEPRLGRDVADFRITYGEAIAGHEHFVELFTDWAVPVCSPKLLAGHALERPEDLFSLPRLNIAWDPMYKPPPRWADWAALISAPFSRTDSGLSFTLSSGAIDAAVAGRGIVLAQVSMITDELATKSLVIPFDIRLKLAESYWLAWDRAALHKPHAAAFKTWLVGISREQAKLSAPTVAD